MTTAEAQRESAIERTLGRVAGDAGILAALRRGVGRSIEESPDSWPYVLEVVGTQRWREAAAHLTLGLFALHHQSQSPGSMNRPDWTLGKACRAVKTQRGSGGASEAGVDRRFQAALAAETPEALGVHLRGLVSILRGAGVPLDYPRLYRDLCSWAWPERRERVCLAWARDYFVTRAGEDKENQS